MANKTLFLESWAKCASGEVTCTVHWLLSMCLSLPRKPSVAPSVARILRMISKAWALVSGPIMKCLLTGAVLIPGSAELPQGSE